MLEVWIYLKWKDTKTTADYLEDNYWARKNWLIVIVASWSLLPWTATLYNHVRWHLPVRMFWKAVSTLVESNADVSMKERLFFSGIKQDFTLHNVQ